jgi:glycosidase
MRAVAVILLCAASLFAQPDKNFVYQIFVRSFADSPTDTAPDGKEIGDLRGILENVEYLSQLHAGILWLMPIFPSGTYHGYDIDDYKAVNPEYGTLDDLDALVKEAHRRGIRIILDIAFNHTSTRHPWFQAALKDPSSPAASFYRVAKDDASPRPQHWHVRNGVRYLGHFGANMPDLNLDHPPVRRELKAAAKFWLNRGIDGFRLDAAKHVYDGEPAKNNEWWREFSEYVYGINPRALLVGEVLSNPEALRDHAAGLDALLDAPFMHAAREYITKPAPGFLKTWLSNVQSYRAVRTTKRPFDTWPFLGSHDETPRLASFIERRAAGRVEQTYTLGLYLLFAISKYPIVYNGDELMQPGIKWRGNPPTAREPGDGSRIYDETIREPFPWRRAESRAPQTSWFTPRYDKPNDGISVEERPGTLKVVQSLSKFRAKHREFASSEITEVFEDSEIELVFERGKYLVGINPTATERPFAAPQKWRRARTVFRTGGKGTASRVIPAYGMIILRAR